jgi:hypothetical protein
MAAAVVEEECVSIRLRAPRDRSVALGLSRLTFALLLLGSASVTAQTQTADQPTRTALDWLETLRANDMDKLAANSRAPFVQDGFSSCSTKRAETTADLTLLLGCVAHSDKFFRASIPVDAKALADWHSLNRLLKSGRVRRLAPSLRGESMPSVGGPGARRARRLRSREQPTHPQQVVRSAHEV